jgi:hypothetical protein
MTTENSSATAWCPSCRRRRPGDLLLDQAHASLARQEPYETVDDWL